MRKKVAILKEKEKELAALRTLIEEKRS